MYEFTLSTSLLHLLGIFNTEKDKKKTWPMMPTLKYSQLTLFFKRYCKRCFEGEGYEDEDGDEEEEKMEEE